jgi:hypothetical protein
VANATNSLANGNHGSTVVQAVVMVTTDLIGNRHFWTTVNKKFTNRLTPKFEQVITLALSINM